MDTKSDDQFLAIEDTIEANKQEADKNHNETTENIKQLTETLNQVLAGLIDKPQPESCAEHNDFTRLFAN